MDSIAAGGAHPHRRRHPIRVIAAQLFMMIRKLKTLACCLGVLAWVSSVRGDDAASKWLLALPGWKYEFPADHAVHRGFKTEWWYFTGNLQNAEGHAFGYELTFFRQGVVPPGADAVGVPGAEQTPSRFVQSDFKFAHFAISDLEHGKFVFTQKISRGAFGEAGFGSRPRAKRASWRNRNVWRGSTIGRAAADRWLLAHQRTGGHAAADVDRSGGLATPKPPVIEGDDGVSQKSAGVGNASHYYSFTRLKTAGVSALRQAGRSTPVTGESWFDHEWASNQLAQDQVGWNWFCFQFDDQTELMLYAMRRRDGTVDPASSGTLIKADGSSEHLERDEFHFTRQNLAQPENRTRPTPRMAGRDPFARVEL